MKSLLATLSSPGSTATSKGDTWREGNIYSACKVLEIQFGTEGKMKMFYNPSSMKKVLKICLVIFSAHTIVNEQV